MARRKLRFLLLDFPSDHEVDRSLSTECEIIQAMLVNRNLGSRSKVIKFSSLKSFDNLPNYTYDPKFVHISCHGGPDSLGLIGGSVTWDDLALKVIKPILRSLEDGETRILFLSCCYSAAAVTAVKNDLPGYFTGAYYYRKDTVPFATSLTVSSMFYRKKSTHNPHEKILQSINKFFDQRLLSYCSMP